LIIYIWLNFYKNVCINWTIIIVDPCPRPARNDQGDIGLCGDVMLEHPGSPISGGDGSAGDEYEVT